MKPSIKNLLLITFFALFTVFSCQDEVFEETQNEEQTLDPNSNVANLMRSTSSNDGATDNILDGADCFSIQLPITIVSNGITITISSLEDLEDLEDIFDEFENQDFEFLFPLTIIFSDYTEIVIEDQEALEDFIDECTESNDEDDVIECVDFVYPISFSIFNTDFDLIDTVTINSDQELYEFLDGLDDTDNALIVSLNYPVTLVYADGSTVTVNSNAELEAAINEAEEDCDDDDENCEIDDVDAYLMTCHWELEEFNGEEVQADIDFYFEQSGTLTVKNDENDQMVTGTWNTEITDEGVVLVIDGLTEFASDYNGEWLLTECDDNEFEFEFIGDPAVFIEMTLEKECDDETDCEPQEIASNLVECVWYSGSDLLPGQDFNGPFTFDEDGSVYLAETGGNAPIGTWSLTVENGYVYLVLDITENPYSEFTGEWKIIECDDDRIKGIFGDSYLVFEQDCETDENVFDCFDDVVITACEENNDNVATFDLLASTVGLVDCSFDFTATFHESQADADANINAIVAPEAYVSSTATIYMRIEALNGDFEVYEIDLIVEDCSGGNCSEQEVDDYLQTCVWNVVNFNGSNDLIEWDLDFNADGTVTIESLGVTLTANWSTSGNTAGQVVIEFSNVAGANIQAINGEWIVFECDPDRLVLANNSDEMVMEQNCD